MLGCHLYLIDSICRLFAQLGVVGRNGMKFRVRWDVARGQEPTEPPHCVLCLTEPHLQMEYERVIEYFHEENYRIKMAIMRVSHFACHIVSTFIDFLLLKLTRVKVPTDFVYTYTYTYNPLY